MLAMYLYSRISENNQEIVQNSKYDQSSPNWGAGGPHILEHMHQVLEGLVPSFQSCGRCCDLSPRSLRPEKGLSTRRDKGQHPPQYLSLDWRNCSIRLE